MKEKRVFDKDGYDQDGYDKDGYDKYGEDKDGYHKSGFKFDRQREEYIHKNGTKYDDDGYYEIENPDICLGDLNLPPIGGGGTLPPPEIMFPQDWTMFMRGGPSDNLMMRGN